MAEVFRQKNPRVSSQKKAYFQIKMVSRYEEKGKKIPPGTLQWYGADKCAEFLTAHPLREELFSCLCHRFFHPGRCFPWENSPKHPRQKSRPKGVMPIDEPRHRLIETIPEERLLPVSIGTRENLDLLFPHRAKCAQYPQRVKALGDDDDSCVLGRERRTL